jgi:hypothetical protein
MNPGNTGELRKCSNAGTGTEAPTQTFSAPYVFDSGKATP